jgi:hypothetical protein
MKIVPLPDNQIIAFTQGEILIFQALLVYKLQKCRNSYSLRTFAAKIF